VKIPSAVLADVVFLTEVALVSKTLLTILKPSTFETFERLCRATLAVIDRFARFPPPPKGLAASVAAVVASSAAGGLQRLLQVRRRRVQGGRQTKQQS